jgi:hypothetical protein
MNCSAVIQTFRHHRFNLRTVHSPLLASQTFDISVDNRRVEQRDNGSPWWRPRFKRSCNRNVSNVGGTAVNAQNWINLHFVSLWRASTSFWQRRGRSGSRSCLPVTVTTGSIVEPQFSGTPLRNSLISIPFSCITSAFADGLRRMLVFRRFDKYSSCHRQD